MSREVREGLWAVSPYNYAESVRAGMELPPRVTVCDLTLREGRQVEGVSLGPEEVVEVARRLDEAGIPMIEMHHDDPAEIRLVKEIRPRFKIQALIHPTAALNPESCRREVEHCVGAGADIVSLAFAVSDYNFRLYESMGGLKVSREEALELACEATRHSKALGVTVSCLFMDFSRLDLEGLKRMAKAVADAGADIIRLDDICAPIMPAVYRHHVREVKRVAPGVRIAIHSHNDFGLATAGQLAALEGGAEILEGTVNGLGERAGVPNLAELVAILEILYGYDTGVHLEKLKGLADFVADVFNHPIPAALPAVGRRAFSHAAEVHYVLPAGDRWSFNAWAAEVVGSKQYVQICHYSGPKSIRQKARELGLGDLSEARAGEVLARVRRELRLRRRSLSDETFAEIVRSVAR